MPLQFYLKSGVWNGIDLVLQKIATERKNLLLQIVLRVLVHYSHGWGVWNGIAIMVQEIAAKNGYCHRLICCGVWMLVFTAVVCICGEYVGFSL